MLIGTEAEKPQVDVPLAALFPLGILLKPAINMHVSTTTVIRTIVLIGISTLVSAGTYITRFHRTQWDDDNWRIITDNVKQGEFRSRMTLANGYLGINLAALGPFFEVDKHIANDNINGWPLFNSRQTFASISGFYGWQKETQGSNYPWLYQYGGESIISGIPHWAGLLIESNGAILNASVDAETIQDFSATMDMGAGVLSWAYSWTPHGGETIKVEYNIFVHKLYVNRAAVQLKLTAYRETNITVYDVLEGDAAVRAPFVDKKYETNSNTIWSAVRSDNVTNVTAYVYSTLRGGWGVDLTTRAKVTNGHGIYGNNQSSIAQSLHVNLVAGKTVEIEKHIGAASSDAFPDPQEVARSASMAGAAQGYVDSLHSHIEEWTSILTKDSVDSYRLPNGTLPDDKNIVELQITSVSNSYHILQNTVGPNAIAAANNNTKLGVNSISVCGIGSDCYGGFVMWDADVWMAPGLLVSHPQHMMSIIRYREEMFPQAQQNVKMAYTSSQNATGKFSGGAVYPWTSGRHGNCTATGPCFDYEYHVNGDIGIAFQNYLVVTGDRDYFQKNLQPIYNNITEFYNDLLDYNETSGHWTLLNATDPDEYANNVDNAGFTIALIQRHLNETNMLNSYFGLPENEEWTRKASKMRLPVNQDAQIILEYQNMQGTISVKQADVILIDDLLHYENDYSLSDLDYYAAKQSLNGPGMTYAAFSIVANEISPSGCSSYTYDLYSSQPYVREPWFQYSEQLVDEYDTNGGTHPGFPFLTGMGGANRIAIFGYLGLRLFIDRLDIDPSLPPQIPYLNFRTFYWQGHGINATSNQTHTTLRRMPPENYTLATANQNYTNHPIPVTLGTRLGHYQLDFDAPLVLPNRDIGSRNTVAGNLLQCSSGIHSQSPHMPGQFPLAAIDGAASTKWQPAHANQTAFISIDLGENVFYPIREMLFDWGMSPPGYFEVFFSNTTSRAPAMPPVFPSYNESDPKNTVWAENMQMVNVTKCNNVTISRPWSSARAAVIEPFKGNQTNVTLPETVWTGRFVHLGISGKAGKEAVNESGATVAEWSLVREDWARVQVVDVVGMADMTEPTELTGTWDMWEDEEDDGQRMRMQGRGEDE
jgi:trehalose/maltose hydrolase-like predicted phosphorylase